MQQQQKCTAVVVLNFKLTELKGRNETSVQNTKTSETWGQKGRRRKTKSGRLNPWLTISDSILVQLSRSFLSLNFLVVSVGFRGNRLLVAAAAPHCVCLHCRLWTCCPTCRLLLFVSSPLLCFWFSVSPPPPPVYPPPLPPAGCCEACWRGKCDWLPQAFIQSDLKPTACMKHQTAWFKWIIRSEFLCVEIATEANQIFYCVTWLLSWTSADIIETKSWRRFLPLNSISHSASFHIQSQIQNSALETEIIWL